MRPSDRLLIFGASARAAAFSAERAGIKTWCADLFADRDLQNRCPVQRVPADEYPRGMQEIHLGAAPAPWMYTGALENHPSLLDAIAKERPLWGNHGAAVALARSPCFVASLLKDGGLPCPSVTLHPEEISRSQRWLVKPLCGAGGRGISFLVEQRRSTTPARIYFQEYIEGDAYSATYVGTGTHAKLLGVTRQLVGQTWLHASPFHYCGSIGPVRLPGDQQRSLERLGTVLAAGCGLRGLFGVDYILHNTTIWPVEINPRYTASIEVLEYATGLSAIALHGNVFDSTVTVLPSSSQPASRIVGKAVLFAKASLLFPDGGPWDQSLCRPLLIHDMPDLADIPHPGEQIEAGKPVMSVFARATSAQACLASLRNSVTILDHTLFGP